MLVAVNDKLHDELIFLGTCEVLKFVGCTMFNQSIKTNQIFFHFFTLERYHCTDIYLMLYLEIKRLICCLIALRYLLYVAKGFKAEPTTLP